MTRHKNKYKAASRRAQKKRTRDDRARKCDEKIKFNSREEALTDGVEVVYECKRCGFWHRTASLLGIVRRRKRNPNKK